MPSSQGLLPDTKADYQARIQVLSDLHLEVGQQYSSYDFPVSAPWLVLAGDVGRLIDYDVYLDFMFRQTNRYQRVFLVLGNHEFYGLDHQAGIRKAHELVAEPRLGGGVVLLHRNQWDDPEPGSNITILGCTLWSRVPDHARDIVRDKVKDYKKIEEWSVDKHNDQHNQDLGWLRERCRELASTAPGQHVLVVSHHAPATKGTSDPRYGDSPWSSAFSTDILGLGAGGGGGSYLWGQVRAWIFGHTHYSTDFIVDGVRVVANQRGYVVPVSSAHKMETVGERKLGRHEFDSSFYISSI